MNMGKKSALDVRPKRPQFKAAQKNSNESKNVQEFQNFVKVNLSKKPDRAK